MVKKIVILGGGIASLATALELTNLSNWQQHYQITLYQMGWRLGGKCATGRNMEKNGRIEEHGLHILFGFYQNAFKLIKQCYDELGLKIEDAFIQHDLIVLEEFRQGKWESIPLNFPRNNLLPWEGGEELSCWDLWEHLQTAIKSSMMYIDDKECRADLLDLMGAIARGFWEDQLFLWGLNSIDDYDYREWLKKHGATEKTINSAFVRVIYNLVYAFPQGDTDNPRLSAAIALRIVYTVLYGYRGSVMWKFRYGMAETVITPMYEVLRRRGVKFKFFHTVEKLHICSEKKHISGITLTKQVNLNVEEEEYNPLIEVKGLKCWPSQPRYEQIKEAKNIKDRNLESARSEWTGVGEIQLKQGTDFDVVVLGISLAALPPICQEILQAGNQASENWLKMFSYVKTVPTQGGQLWLNTSLENLGWKYKPPVLGAFVEPLDVYADMSELIEWEDWEEEKPKSIAYFTGVIKETEKAQTIAFLNSHIQALWPNFNWQNLIDSQERSGEKRLDAQYWRVNVEATDRYVLSVPGSLKYRLKPDQSGYNNLILVGDWVNNGYNSGCVEATVLSGKLATQAIWEKLKIQNLIKIFEYF